MMEIVNCSLFGIVNPGGFAPSGMGFELLRKRKKKTWKAHQLKGWLGLGQQLPSLPSYNGWLVFVRRLLDALPPWTCVRQSTR